MDISRGRRAFIGALLADGVAGSAFSPVRGYLERFAPLSGSAWDSTQRPDRTVNSPYGNAVVRYDEYGVPNVTGSNERAVYFAVGYTQACDRAFQMNLQRRLMRGQLSAVVGEATLDSDEFHAKMDFAGAARANWSLLEETDVGTLIEAYTEGVNAAFENEPRALEFSLLEYEPDSWTPVDTMLMEKQIAWNLTGSFRTLRTALAADTRKRALLTGFGFGVLVWTAFAVALLAGGDFGKYLEMRQLLGVSVAIPVVAATFAALVRWLV